MTKKRETELDLLRIIALLAVILVHTGGGVIDSLSHSNRNWIVIILLRAAVTWQVPCYVMISGRFFLDVERAYSKKKMLKAIWRIAVAFLFWNIFYQAYYLVSGAYDGLNWKGYLSMAMIGPYHFWYLWMIVFLYAITPFLRRIAESKELMEYYIGLFIVFEFLNRYGAILPMVGGTISEILSKVGFHFALGYSGYYVLGYYLKKYPIKDRYELPLYVLGILMLLFKCIATYKYNTAVGKEDSLFTKYCTPNVIIESAALYTFFIKRVSTHCFSEHSIRTISKLAENSFGVFLVHALVNEAFAWIENQYVSAWPVPAMLITMILVFCISNLIVMLVRRIPVIGKRIA